MDVDREVYNWSKICMSLRLVKKQRVVEVVGVGIVY